MTIEKAIESLSLLRIFDAPDLNEAVKMAVSALRSQADTPPSDEPLTIEELRKMDGKPVYDWMGYEWFVVSEVTDGEVIMTDGTVFDIDEDSPNNAALRFCRREPEE